MYSANRREFLCDAAAAAFLLAHGKLVTGEVSPFQCFVDTITLKHWQVHDPVQWSLQNAENPILQNAAKGLSGLTVTDGERIVRLVVRRCYLNLVELRPENVIVHYWANDGLADLRPFFKANDLARSEVTVILRNRKTEAICSQSGERFLYGEAIADDSILCKYETKWRNRYMHDGDDQCLAPLRSAGFIWRNGNDVGAIPWSVLKNAWRSSIPPMCLNCDTPTVLLQFGKRPVGMVNRVSFITFGCFECRRTHTVQPSGTIERWLAMNLDAKNQPSHQLVWGKPVPLVCDAAATGGR
jgi:hypothetical protein